MKPSIALKQRKSIPLSERTSVDINIGDNITSLTETFLNIQCSVSGMPTPEVTWSKDGQLLGAGANVVIHNNGTLSVRGVTPEDSGRYTCTAQNVAGRQSVESDIKVLGKPFSSEHVNLDL